MLKEQDMQELSLKECDLVFGGASDAYNAGYAVGHAVGKTVQILGSMVSIAALYTLMNS